MMQAVPSMRSVSTSTQPATTEPLSTAPTHPQAEQPLSSFRVCEPRSAPGGLHAIHIPLTSRAATRVWSVQPLLCTTDAEQESRLWQVCVGDWLQATGPNHAR